MNKRSCFRTISQEGSTTGGMDLVPQGTKI